MTIVDVKEIMKPKEEEQVCGTDASGCRLSFDLGKSDIKSVAVKDNEILYSHEQKWDVTNPDPDYHFDAIVAELKKADEAAKKKAPGFKCAGVSSMRCC